MKEYKEYIACPKEDIINFACQHVGKDVTVEPMAGSETTSPQSILANFKWKKRFKSLPDFERVCTLKGIILEALKAYYHSDIFWIDVDILERSNEGICKIGITIWQM